MYVLGISAYYHDSAAALIRNGKVLYAAQEERFSRIKNDSSFPIQAIKYVLLEEGLELSQIDHIIFYDKPWLKFERIVDTILNQSPRSLSQFLAAMPSWLGEKLNFRKTLKEGFNQLTENFEAKNILFSEHHFSHAASTFYTSPFKDACVINIDGVGEWATLSIYDFNESGHNLIKQMNFPNSIGILYSAFTFYCGFKINSGEYKLMGLAPYGRKEEAQKIKQKIQDNLYQTFEDGSIKINLSFFKYHFGNKTINEKKWESLFNLPVNTPDSEMTQAYCDFALGAQLATEDILTTIIRHARTISKSQNLCLSGGVALNCVANTKIKKDNQFQNIWIHPAPGDAGGAIGAALGFYYSQEKYNPQNLFDPYLGPRYSNYEIERSLKKYQLNFRFLNEIDLYESVAQTLLENKIVGWFQDRMEWGPRALGNRSILASPLDREMQKKLNLKIKFREGFRPFAPVALESKADQYFQPSFKNPYMQYTHQVVGFEEDTENITTNKFSNRLSCVKTPLPAITHLDGSARLQTVNEELNRKLTHLLIKFEEKSGVPVLINTSFNVRGEPIVCSPENAIECFLSTDMDILVLGNFIACKDDNIEKAKKFRPKSFSKD